MSHPAPHRDRAAGPHQNQPGMSVGTSYSMFYFSMMMFIICGVFIDFVYTSVGRLVGIQTRIGASFCDEQQS